jgi:hypothetical protein
MAKTNALNVRLYAGSGTSSKDLSGDVSALTNFGISANLLSVSTLADAAEARIQGSQSSTIGVSSFFDTSLGHTVWSGLPTGDQNVMIPMQSGTLGGATLHTKALQANYNTSGDAGTSPVSCEVSYESTGGSDNPAFGVSLTAGKITSASAENLADVDNTTATTNGWTACLFCFSIASGSIIVKLQDSPDDVTYTDLTGGTFSTLSGVGSEIIASASGASVARHVRASLTSTYGTSVLAVSFNRK